MRQRPALFVSISIVVLILGYLFFSLPKIILDLLPIAENHATYQFVRLFGLIGLTTGFFFLIYLYLQGVIKVPAIFKKLIPPIPQRSPFRSTRQIKRAALKVDPVGESQPADIINPTAEEIFQNQIQHAIEGLTSEVESTRNNSHINLAIGGGTTLLAIGVLAIALWNGGFKIEKPLDYLQYAPRITFAIFIEVFSFFFLKLYRRNLDDIKYLTNEITNVKLRLIALRASFLRDSGDFTGGILLELSKTERNFVLRNGESTVEIQRMKIESDEQAKLIENISAIFRRDAARK